MSFDVDAFMGAPAAPPAARAEALRASDGPSFDDHLDEATAEPEAVETQPVDKKAKETPDQPEQPAAAPATPTPPPQPQAPIVIQLIADAPPVAEAPADGEAAAEKPESAPQAPSAPPVEPVKAETVAAPQPSAAAPVEATQAKNDAPAKSDAPVKPETAKAEAPVVEDGSQTQTQIQTQTPQQPPAPQQAPPQAIAQAAPAPVQTVAAPAAETETASGDDAATAPETPSLDATDDKRSTKADAEPRTDAPKANNSANARDSFAAFAALAAQDGQQAQAPAQTAPASAIGSAELTAQSGQVMPESAARAAPAVTQVSREIIRRFNGQTTSLELRLDPPELGKVEVRLEVSRDHKVTAVVSAENPAALAELARNARDLQQALQSAGLELSDNGLSFDLKQQRESRADSEGGSPRSNTGGEDAAPTPAPTPSRPIGLESWRGVRVDLVA